MLNLYPRRKSGWSLLTVQLRCALQPFDCPVVLSDAFFKAIALNCNKREQPSSFATDSSRVRRVSRVSIQDGLGEESAA
jgi:hypothetical protein